MTDRRAFLRGLAALPVAGGGVSAMAAPAVDPFTSYHLQILAVHRAIDEGVSEPEVDRLMDRWGDIDRLALAGQPTTLAGAIGAVEYARREHHQMRIEGIEESGQLLEATDVLILHLLDGTIGMLRQLTGGGVA